MKKIILVLAMILITLTCGCQRKESYKYMQETTEIMRVEIVELVDFNQTACEFEEAVIYTVEEVETFVDELSNINCVNHFGDPMQLEEGYIVIRITYDNGEYELIHSNAQEKYNKEFWSYGYQKLDIKQFDELISKYLEKN